MVHRSKRKENNKKGKILMDSHLTGILWINFLKSQNFQAHIHTPYPKGYWKSTLNLWSPLSQQPYIISQLKTTATKNCINVGGKALISYQVAKRQEKKITQIEDDDLKYSESMLKHKSLISYVAHCSFSPQLTVQNINLLPSNAIFISQCQC